LDLNADKETQDVNTGPWSRVSRVTWRGIKPDYTGHAADASGARAESILHRGRTSE